MSSSLNALVDDLRPYAIDFVSQVGAAGYQPRVTSTRRSRADQERLYRRYLAGQSGGLPAAPPGASAHEYGWAFDMVVEPYSGLSDVGHFWISQYGGEWGGKRDPVHFQLPGATEAAKSMLRDELVASTPDQSLDSPWWNPKIVPAWMMSAFELVPHYATVRDILENLGIPAR